MRSSGKIKKIKWITKDNLTMEKWDELVLILKESNLEELLGTMHQNIKGERNMKDTIRDTAL